MLPLLESPASESVTAGCASKASVNEHLAVMLKDKQSAKGWAIRSLPTWLSKHPASNPIPRLRRWRTQTLFKAMQNSSEGRRRQIWQTAVSYLTCFHGGSSPSGRPNFLANILEQSRGALHILKRRSNVSPASASAECTLGPQSLRYREVRQSRS